MFNPLWRSRQHLIFDADDTLWENNIYFEAAFDAFVRFLDHEHLSSSEIQLIVDEMELETRQSHGYGARAFAHGLRLALQKIAGLEDGHPDLDEAERLGLRVLEAPFALMPNVVETLTALKPHHTLHVLTKGHKLDQQAKLEQSELESFFATITITAEKNLETYGVLLSQLQVPPDRVWMIGNSPRSDVNPALAAGLNAIHIPHPRTWHLEMESINATALPQRVLLEIASFSDLSSIFVQGESSLHGGAA